MNSESINVRLDHSKALISTRRRKHQYGAAIAELVVVLPALLMLGLGVLESALFYQAKTTVTYATFEAARKGATTHAQKGPMRDEFGLRIAPIFGGDGSGSKAQTAIGKGVVDAHNPIVTSIDIINPNSEAFLEFGVKNGQSGVVEIPNTHLRYRDPNIVGSESKVNVQDANLLKIQTKYGYQLKVPFVSQIITSLMKQFDPGNAVQFYDQGRIPITAVATVRMQSAAWEDGNLLADGTDPNGGNVDNGAAGEPGGHNGEGGESSEFSSLNPMEGQGGSTPDPFGPGPCPANTSCGTGDPSQQCSAPLNSEVALTSAQSGLPSKEVGNPINVVSGNKYQYEDDFPALPGALGLAWGRHYNSQSHSKRGLGVGWQHLFDVRAKRMADGSIRIVQADGRQIVFAESEPGRFGSLLKSDGWIIVSDDADFNIKERMSWHWPNGKRLRFTARGALSDINLPTGEWLKLQYDDANKLILVKDPQERQISLGYYPNGRLKNVLDPLGKSLRYRYDRLGNLASVSFADGRTKQYHYEDKGDPSNLTGITDQRGVRFASWSYDGQDRAVTSEHAEGVEAVSIVYADDGSRLVTNSLQEVSTYFTDVREGMGVVTAIQGPGCSSCGTGDVNYEYNAQLQLVRSKQANGRATIREYDAYGRTILVKQEYPDGSEQLLARYEYDTAERSAPSKIFKPSVNPDGAHSYSLYYNDDEQLVEMLEHGWTPTEQGQYELQKRRTQLTYSNGLLIALDGPRKDVNDTTRIYYDAKRRLQKLQTPDGRILAVKAYDDYGRPTEIQQGQQQTITMAYNQRGDVTSVKQRGQTTQYQYDAAGQLITVIGPDGESLRITYDAAGRASEVTGPNGRKILTELDSEGTVIGNQILSEQGGVLAQISYLYDAEGRLSQIQRNGKTSQSREYDEQGNVANTTDAGGNLTAFNYSSLGELLAITQPNSNVTRLSYDSKRNVKSVTDARNNNTEYAYNDFGQLVRSHSPDTGVQQYKYDLAGNQLQKTDASGATSYYEYDAANRMTHRRDADGSTRYHYEVESGRLSKVEDPNSLETLAYNRDAQLIEHTRTFNEKLTFTTRYSYSSQGKILSKELPDGQRLVYHYHESGNSKGTLKAITRDDLIGQTTIIGELNTNDTVTIETYTHGNGLEVTKETDGLGTAVALYFGEALALNYQYDELGRIVGIDENAQQNRFDYDVSGQLLGANTLLGRFEYEYDEVGNRTRKTHEVNDQETEERYTYASEGEGNRLLGVNEEIRSYNSAGNPQTTDKFRYEYNAQQRPVRVFDVESNALIAQYQYNSFGARIKKVAYKHRDNTSRKTITYYLYDGRKLAAEISEDGEVLAQYLYYKGQVIAKLQSRDIFAVHTDHLGTPKAVTDHSRTVVWAAEYTPFGEASLEVADITLNLRLPGQYFDAETETHYNYYRDYDPSTGRYAQSDPIGLAGGINTYAYVGGNPISYGDPLGLYLVAFDGTGNDKDGTPPTGSHVATLYDYYRGTNGDESAAYYPGVGTNESNGFVNLMGSITGYGGQRRIEEAISDLIKHLERSNDTTIDIIGFSRGAALARAFANELLQAQSDGRLPKAITIRFMGLFDTVGSIGLGGNDVDCGYDFSIPEEVQKTVQAYALNEHRSTFDLQSVLSNRNSLNAKPRLVEQGFVGAHSDIGGGYHDESDLGDVTLKWMFEQLEAAGAELGELECKHRYVENTVFHDSRYDGGNRYTGSIGDREIFYNNDDDWVASQKPEIRMDRLFGVEVTYPNRPASVYVSDDSQYNESITMLDYFSEWPVEHNKAGTIRGEQYEQWLRDKGIVDIDFVEDQSEYCGETGQ